MEADDSDRSGAPTGSATGGGGSGIDREEDDVSHRSNASGHSSHDNDRSFDTAHSSSTTATGQHNQQQHRSRNNSEMSFDTGTGSGNHGGGGGGPCFFADMTLDISMAQMETTPRTDMKFASMASTGISSGDAAVDRSAVVRSVPPMPLIEEPEPPHPPSPLAVADGGSIMDGDRAGGGDHGGGGSVEVPNGKAPSGGVEGGGGGGGGRAVERSFARIESDGAVVSRGSYARAGGGSSRDEAASRGGHVNGGSSHSSSARRPARAPRRPRDVSWTAAALLAMPLGLLAPRLYYTSGYAARLNASAFDNGEAIGSWAQMAQSSASHATVLLSSLAAAAASYAVLNALYSHPGGGEGDDARHVGVTRTLLASSNVALWLNPLVGLCIYAYLPGARAALVLPAALVARDAFRLRNSGSALPRSGGALGRGRQPDRGARRGGGPSAASMSALSSQDRKTFFRALAVAALDILSRSLRRRSFVRATSALLLAQFVCISAWWGALSATLSVAVLDSDGAFTRFARGFWLLVTLVSGKWATGTIARLLGFVASGGVASWFSKQTVVIERMMDREQAARRQDQVAAEGDEGRPDCGVGDGQDEHASEYSSGYAARRAELHAMPEAYRTADASAYASVMDFDEGSDDDGDYEEEGDDFGGPQSFRRGGEGGGPPEPTVKSFLAAGCTFSFGSVAQCGLTGGLAQFLWSFVRNIDAMGFFLQRRFDYSSSSSAGFRGMDIGGGGASPRMWKQRLASWWRRMDVAIRAFVRSHSDLAMSHVAAYYKSYQRAANDVAALIESSGVESIIHDDITTHMCSSLGHLIAGSIVLFFGMLLVTHRNSFATDPLSDASLLETLLISYVLCYTILFTVLEPLRAAIKAIYVCFAEHPLSLSQAFPLIYQRLSRISEPSSNM